MIRHLATLIICFALRADVMAVVPRDTVLRESVATVERNFFYDEEGRLVFEQALFIDVVDGEENIVAWRLIKDPCIIPRRDWSTGGYVATWLRGRMVSKFAKCEPTACARHGCNSTRNWRRERSYRKRNEGA